MIELKISKMLYTVNLFRNYKILTKFKLVHITERCASSMIKEPIKKISNIGIFGNINAGRNVLKNRILYYTGRIEEMHEVRGKDKFGSKNDSMELEQMTGINLSSAASYLKRRSLNFDVIDTPEHVDSIEVERAVKVLDGAILVVCCVSGVQSQTATVVRLMKDYNVPFLSIINKIDIAGADHVRVLSQLRSKLNQNCALVQIPIRRYNSFEGLINVISRKALYFDGECGEILRENGPPHHLISEMESTREELIEHLSNVDDHLRKLHINKKLISNEDIEAAIRNSCLQQRFTPIFLGTALKNKGVQAILDAVFSYLPYTGKVQHFALKEDGGSGTEPLTANIKPLTSPSTSGASLRHSPHPHSAAAASRPTPTASIRPMAIGTVSPATPTQTRMAAVLPTTATPSHSDEDTFECGLCGKIFHHLEIFLHHKSSCSSMEDHSSKDSEKRIKSEESGMTSWVDPFSSKKSATPTCDKEVLNTTDASSPDSRLSNLQLNLPTGLQKTSDNSTPHKDYVKGEYSGQNKPLQDNRTVFSIDTHFLRLIKSKTYIDKTELIPELLGFNHNKILSEHKVHLITCPRRFGKSINMEMIKIFLSIEVNKCGKIIEYKDTELFKVLETMGNSGKKLNILNHQFMEEHFKKYPIIFIDFQNLRENNLRSLKHALRHELYKTFSEHAYMLKIFKKITDNPLSEADDKRRAQNNTEKFLRYFSSDGLTGREITCSLEFLSEVLSKHFEKRVIILIDEYDKPVNFSITNPREEKNQNRNIKEIQSFIDNFLIASLKANINLQMGVLTGVSGIVRASENSGLNNIRHWKFLSPNNKFQKYYGVTEQELDNLIGTLKFPNPCELKQILKKKYNGYIDYSNINAENSLYNIYAVMNECCILYHQMENNQYFPNHEANSHWTDSANIKCIKNTFKLPQIRKLNEKLLAGEKINMSLKSRVTIDDLVALKQLSSSKVDYKVTDNHIKLFFSYIFESGYLNVEVYKNECYISIPNSDIRDEFINFHIDYFVNEYSIFEETLKRCTETFTQFIKNFEGKKNEFLMALNVLFKEMSYAKIKEPKSENQINEDLIHSIMNNIILKSQEIKKFGTEIPLKNGIDRVRPDIIFITHSNVAGIVEVKFLLSANDALKQTEPYARILKSQYPGNLSKIIQIGINVSKTNEVDLLYKVHSENL